MLTELTNCPNCGVAFTSGMLATIKLLAENKIAIINEYHEKKSSGYCSKCGNELYNTYKSKFTQEKLEIIEKMQILISAVPVISAQIPLNWDYEILDMITGQSTTGTGVVSEFVSSFADLFGLQSSAINRKLKDGESICFSQLRKQAIDMGGSAVIATDIDYSEVGGAKGMLMVCMAGTAIRLKNTDILGEKRAEALKKIEEINNRLLRLNSFKLDVLI